MHPVVCRGLAHSRQQTQQRPVLSKRSSRGLTVDSDNPFSFIRHYFLYLESEAFGSEDNEVKLCNSSSITCTQESLHGSLTCFVLW